MSSIGNIGKTYINIGRSLTFLSSLSLILVLSLHFLTVRIIIIMIIYCPGHIFATQLSSSSLPPGSLLAFCFIIIIILDCDMTDRPCYGHKRKWSDARNGLRIRISRHCNVDGFLVQSSQSERTSQLDLDLDRTGQDPLICTKGTFWGP